MKKRSLGVLLIVITVVAILHLIRAIFGWSLIVGGFDMPIWLSYVAFLVLGYLGYDLFKSLKK